MGGGLFVDRVGVGQECDGPGEIRSSFDDHLESNQVLLFQRER